MVSGGEYVDVKERLVETRPILHRFIVPQYEIVQYFSRVQSKSRVVDGFLRFGNHCFANLAIFSVFSRAIQFLKGTGDNIKRPPHLGAFSVDKNTIIRRAIVNKFPYKGPIPVGSDEKDIFSRFFNEHAEEVFIYPGSIQGEDTDTLFYADGFEEDRESSLATFEYVVEKAILSLKFLWVQRQLTTI